MKYLIVGNGRVATHFRHYFDLFNITSLHWHRAEPLEELKSKSLQVDCVLLALPDSVLTHFLINNPYLEKKLVVHFSGAFTSDKMIGAHPLFTFSHKLYDLETYKSIPFVMDDGGPKFQKIFPQLPNPNFKLDPRKKSLYHSLCVLSGNFTALLWQNTFKLFNSELNLPPSILNSYLEQIVKNLKLDPTTALTGPLVRGDRDTIIKNLDALSSRPEQKIYYAFLNYFFDVTETKGKNLNEHLDV